MTVRELIEVLEQLPLDLPVATDECEISEVVVRDEVYFSAEHKYEDGQVVKVL